MSPILLVELTGLHFISDFLLQSDWMAVNKSKNQKALWAHCFTYGIPFIYFGNIHFVAYIILTHYFVDFVTSRITSYFWKKEERHWFFVTIGFDQWLHFIILLAGCFFYGIIE